MSTNHFEPRKALANPTTETVFVEALQPGDLIYVPGDTSGPDPWRVRFLDQFPGGIVNVLATPGAQLQHSEARSIGVWTGDVQQVKRVVL